MFNIIFYKLLFVYFIVIATPTILLIARFWFIEKLKEQKRKEIAEEKKMRINYRRRVN